ncbi:MFS transporter [Actinokineospora enzanensis]|uniref:MFS transporter n=1 Tax=Actinokineospora enzanensis TaxID=155975 RepID=UPI00035D896D|nr:MFS transporter [Actinokineospora enzanensis]
MTGSHTQDAAATAPPGPARPGLVLLVVCLAQFIVVLDVSIVNLALPHVADELGMNDADVQWVVNAYTVTLAGFLLLGGRLADLYGRRRMFLVGLGLFVLASLAGGLAQGGLWLVIARAVQGLGAAVVGPTTLTVLTTSFTDPAARGKAIGAWSAVAAGGGAVGALLGGILTEYLTWRAVLLVNVPLGLILMVLAVSAITEAPGTGKAKLDIAGAVSVTAGLAAVVYGIVAVADHPFGSVEVLLPLLAGVALLVVFVVVERTVAAPIVPLDFFKHRNLTLANIVALIGGTAMVAMFFFLSLSMQKAFQWSAVEAGLAFLPLSGAVVVGSMVSMKTLKALGPRPLLVVGGLVATAGLLWMSRTPVDASFVVDLLGPTVLAGLGMGLVMVPITSAATSGLEPARAGLASGVISTTRQLGGAIGLATLVTAATAHAASLTASGTARTAALTSGYDRGFLLCAALLLVGTLVSGLLPGRPKPA